MFHSEIIRLLNIHSHLSNMPHIVHYVYTNVLSSIEMVSYNVHFEDKTAKNQQLYFPCALYLLYRGDRKMFVKSMTYISNTKVTFFTYDSSYNQISKQCVYVHFDT